MAGSLKPTSYIQNGIEYNINLIETFEGTLDNGIVISNNLKMVSNSYGSVEKLFDESLPTGYSNTGIMLHSKSYNGNDYYWEFQVTSDCQLFGINNLNYTQSILPFSIYTINGDIESLYYTMQDSTIINGKWYMICPKLKANQTYRLKANGTGHSAGLTEVYFNVLSKCIIKMNNKYYSFKKENYNNNNQMYNEIVLTNNVWDEYGSSISDFTKEITIDGEMFKPIDKFDQFQLISETQTTYNITTLKSDKELIISNQNLSTVNAEMIHNFVLETNKVANGDIKFVISNDNGVTWQTWNGSNWTSLTNTCSLKKYSLLSDSEKIQWDKLKEEIWSSGISTDTTGIDYNIILTNKTIRFAFVLYRPTYEDNISLKDTQWLFDKVGSWHKLSEDDIDIAINSNSCIVTPKLQNLEHVKVNILI